MVQTSRPAALWISSSRPNMTCAFTVNDAMKTGGRHRSRQGSTRTRESNGFEMEAGLRNFLSAALHNWVTGSTSDHCYFGSVVTCRQVQIAKSCQRFPKFLPKKFSVPPLETSGYTTLNSRVCRKIMTGGFHTLAARLPVLRQSFRFVTVVQLSVAQNINPGIECKWHQSGDLDEPRNRTQNR